MESQNIEYKQSWRDEYLKWICGFANAQGGTLYVGIDDNGNVCGINNAKQLMEEIPNKVRDILGIIVDIQLLQKEGKDYLAIITPPYSNPISYKGQYHYRSGSTKQELKGAALQDFLLRKIGRQWDDLSHETATIDCIDPKAIGYFLRKGIDAHRIDAGSLGDTPLEVLENLRLLGDDGKLKYAAILLFAKDPLRYFPGVQFKIGRFGINETDLISQDVIEGNLIQMADRVMEVLKNKYLHSLIHYEGMQRIEPLEIPEDAFREILYNAIVHRRYPGAAIQMRIYADHIELWSDGTLPEGYTIETLMRKHSSQPRNNSIANIFYKAGFIEAWGRGISKIHEGFSSKGLNVPTYEENSGGILVTIPRRKQVTEIVGNGTKDYTKDAAKELTERQKVILDLLSKDGSLTSQKISQKISQKKPISIRTIISDMKVLQDIGYIKRIGGRKDGHWLVLSTDNKIYKQ